LFILAVVQCRGNDLIVLRLNLSCDCVEDVSAFRVMSISRNRRALQYKKLELIVGFHVFPANERVTDGARTSDLLLSHDPMPSVTARPSVSGFSACL
jgi:hypothetical protein